MRESEIKLRVVLDDENIPEKIYWDATDKGSQGEEEAKSISLNIWDHLNKNTMRIDLWSKDMPMDEMKRFYVDCLVLAWHKASSTLLVMNSWPLP